MPAQSDFAVSARLDRLQQYLEVDPRNLALLGDAAEAAYVCGKLDVAGSLLDRYQKIEDLPHPLVNLAGVVALAGGRPLEAVGHFSVLQQRGIDDPGIRFNLAWAHSLLSEFAQSAQLLDDTAVAVSPRGPVLKVQALHHLGDFQAALDEGRRLMRLFPHDASLLGALSMLAMDADDAISARCWALAAAEDHQALTVLGMLALDDQAVEEAGRFFDRALTLQPASPRALIGKGLEEMAIGHYGQAAEFLSVGSAGFGSHLGSWVASGWALLLAGDLLKAGEAFERVLAIDDTFAEGHGGLAIVALHSGEHAKAERFCEVALRLDRQSLGGTLARVLLLQTDGKAEVAERLMSSALSVLLANQQTSLTKHFGALVRAKKAVFK